MTYRIVGECLLKNFTVYIPDMYKGFSKHYRLPHSIDDYCTALHTFCSSLNIKKYFLIGFSASGLVATRYCQLYPDEVKRMLLFSTSVAPIRFKYKFFHLIAGYAKLTVYYLYPRERLALDILWYKDTLYHFFRTPIRLLREIVIVVQDAGSIIKKFPVQTKLYFALKDEFLPRSVHDANMNIENLEVISVDDDHCWFFRKKEAFASIVKTYFV